MNDTHNFSPVQTVHKPKLATVWIIEDDEDQAELLTFLFEREGFGYMLFGDGVQCIAQAKKTAIIPDALIVDINLPYMNGFEVVVALRALPNWADVPMIVISARAGSHDIAKAFECGANDYVRKPFDPIEMFARLRRLLPEHHQKQSPLKTEGQQ